MLYTRFPDRHHWLSKVAPMKFFGKEYNFRTILLTTSIPLLVLSGWSNVISLGPVPVKEQPVNLQVLDKKTKLPVPWATVFSKKNGYGVVADKDGFCEFTVDIEKGDTLLISSIGYSAISVVFNRMNIQEINKIYLAPFGLTNEPVVINSKKGRSGFDLIKEFKKSYSNNYPLSPFSGNIYVNIGSMKDSVTIRNTEYVSAFYCSTGYESPLRSLDSLLKKRTEQEVNAGEIIPNRITAAIIALESWFEFQKIDILPYLKGLDEKNTRITSVTSFLFNGVRIYKVNASLMEPLIYSKRVSRVDLELFLSGLDFSVIKYKISYTILFDNSGGKTDCIDMRGKRQHFTTPPGFAYDTIKNIKEVYFYKNDKVYLPFYCTTVYTVCDEQLSTAKKGRFEETREYFIFGTKVFNKPATSTPRDMLNSILSGQEISDKEFWRGFVKPEKQRVMRYLTDLTRASD